MVKDVIITVKGFQPGTSEESIKVEVLGSYHYRNGSIIFNEEIGGGKYRTRILSLFESLI